MADRGLSAAAIAAYGGDAVDYAYLYEIGFSSATLYYTSYEHGVTAIGSDAAQHPYLSNGLIINNPKISESLEIKPSTTQLTMAGASAALHNLTLSENYRNAPVYIYLHEFSTGETNQIFKGYIDSYKTTENTEKGKSSVVWTLANHWKNWDAEEGRFISDQNQQELFTGDLGLEFSNIPPSLTWWGSIQYNDDYANAEYNSKLADIPFFEYVFPPWTANNFNADPAELADFNAKTFKARLPIIYGTKKVKGVPVFAGIPTGQLNYLWIAYAISEGECDDLVQIYFDDRAIDDTDIAPYVQMVKATNFHAGNDNQTSDTELTTVFAQWTTNHRLRGICYCAIRYTYNEEIWVGEIPNPLFEIKGKQLYDPRDFSTTYSTNPALILYDYLTSIRYGKSMTGTDLVGFGTGATYCDTLKTDNLGGSPTQIKLFDFNGIVNTTDKIKDNVEKILFTMRGHLPYVNGEYKLIIESELETGTFVIDKDNIKGDFIVSEGSISTLINSITYDYIDIDAGDQTEQVMIENDALIALDSGRVLKKNYTNKYETNRYRAKNRANTLLKKSREQLRVTCYLSNLEAIKLEPGVIVKLTDTLRGWNEKENRIESMDYILADGSIKLNLVEYEPTVYDWTVYGEFLPQINTDLISPFTVLPPTGLLLTSGTAALYKNADGTIISRIHATFTAPATVMFSGYIVYIQKTGEAEVLYRAINDITNTDLYIEPVEDGAEYTVSVTAVNSLGVESERVSDIETVAGKSELPLPITSINTGSIDKNVVNLFWSENTEIDFSHYEVWAHEIDLLGAATLIGTTTGNTLNHAVSVTTYYWIRCVDTTGNKSPYYPLVNGVPGTPDGTTDPAIWEEITGKPPDSTIVNTINFTNRFELDDFDLWTSVIPGDLAQSTDAYSGTYAGLFRSTLSAPVAAGGEVPYIDIPEGIALAFAGKKVRIVVYAKQTLMLPSTSFAMAYVTSGDGTSGWSDYFVPPINGGNFSTFGFTYNVPLNDIGQLFDRIEIWADTTGGNGGVLIDNVVIDILSSWDEISGDVNAPLDNADVTNYSDYRVSNSDDSDSFTTVANPQGARFDGGLTATQTGAIVVVLPQSWTRTMMKFVIDVYLYADPADDAISKSFTISVGGYNHSFSGGFWDREFAQLSGDASSNNRVRFMHNGTFCCVVIGDETDVWDFPTVSVRSFIGSYLNYELEKWDGSIVPWDIIFEPDLSTYVTSGDLTDSLLDARSIIGQGALALLDDVLYTTQVVGGPPVDADVSTAVKIGVKINYITFLTATNAHAYFHGFDVNGDAADVSPVIASNGTNQVLSVGKLNPDIICEGYIVYVSSGWGINNDKYAIGIPNGSTTSSWTIYYDGAANSRTLATEFYFVIGVAKTEAATTTILSAYTWGHGIRADMALSYQADLTDYDDYRVTNSSESGSMLTIKNPYKSLPDEGAVYSMDELIGGGTSTVTGAIVIVLPQTWTNTMLKFVVDVFLYETEKSFTISVGGYTYITGSTWDKTFAQLSGNAASNNKVRFGHDGTHCVVIIGDETDVWNRPKITVRDFQAGYNNYEFFKWDDDWDILVGLIETHATLTYAITGSISDALLDSASILNQGVLATEDEWNNYNNVSYYKEIDFESTEMLLWGPTGSPTGCYSIDYAGLHLTQCTAGTAAATRQMNDPPGISLATYEQDTRWKATVKISGTKVTNNIVPFIAVGSAVHVGIEFNIGAFTTSAYGVVFRSGIRYTTLIKSGVLSNTAIHLEVNIVLGSHVLFDVDGTQVSWNTNPVVATDGLQTVIFHAEIPYTGNVTGTLDVSEFVFERLKP